MSASARTPARWRCRTPGCGVVLGLVGADGLLYRLYPLIRQPDGSQAIRCPKCAAARPCHDTAALPDTPAGS